MNSEHVSFLSFVVALSMGVGTAMAQQVPLQVSGDEIFITMDADLVPPFICDWATIRCRDLSGAIETIDLFQGTPVVTGPPGPPLIISGAGNFGPIFPTGSYVFEPFALSQSLGNLGGLVSISAICTSSTLPPCMSFLAIESHAGVAPGVRLGYRLARQDGRPFGLVSVDYRNAVSDFQIGTRLSAYFDFASFGRATPNLGLSTFSTMTFTPGPLAVEEVKFQDGPGQSLVTFNSSTGTASVTAVIESILFDNGSLATSSSVDALVGGTLTITGPYIGNDTAGLSDFQFLPASMVWTTTTGLSLVVAPPLAAGSSRWMLEGEYDAEPTRLRSFSSAMAPGGTIIGQGSFSLELLRSQASFENVHLEMRTSSSTFALVRFSRPMPTPTTVPLSAFVSTGSGGARLGLVSPYPSTELRHFIAVNSPIAVGTGPFFGIEFGPDQLLQTSFPLGLQPFRVTTDATGSYAFSVANGTIPAGLVADLVAIVLASPSALAAPPIRVVF